MKVMNKHISFILLFFLSLLSCDLFEDDEDSEEEDEMPMTVVLPLQLLEDTDGDGLLDINSIDDLLFVSLEYNSEYFQSFNGFELKRDLDFDNPSHYESDTLIDLLTQNEGWIPIGNRSSPFNVVFNGGGHTISNLFLDRNGKENGFFGYIDEHARLSNINLEIAFFATGSSSGGLVGVNEGGAIENSSVRGSIVGVSSIGGLVGFNSGNIQSCFTSGVIIGSSKLGGLVGELSNGQENSISFCFSTMNINATSSAVGGLVGSISFFGEIRSCYATGNVTSSSSSVGGLIGTVRSCFVRSCYALGDVRSSSSNVGGLVGIDNSFAVLTSYSTGVVDGTNRVGGLIGSGGFNINNSNYWDIETSGIEFSTAGTGLPTIQLQGQTSNTGIYLTWDPEAWDFGNTVQYPALLNMPGGLNAQGR